MSAAVPSLDHATFRDFDNVYEPSEDTFLLLDAILKHADELAERRPAIQVEIGHVAPRRAGRHAPRVTICLNAARGAASAPCTRSRRSPSAGAPV